MWATPWPSRCTLTHPLNGVKKALNPDKQGIYIRYIVKNDSIYGGAIAHKKPLFNKYFTVTPLPITPYF